MLSGRSVAKLRLKVLSPRLNLKYYVEDSNHSIKKNKCVFICHIHNYTEYNQRWNVFSVFNPSKCAHTWSSGHTHTHAHTPGAVDTHTRTHTHLEQWTHTHTHLEQWTHTHTHTHTHLEQWTHTHTHLDQWGSSGEQLGVRCLAQGSHLSRGQFLPEPRFEPTTSGYKSDAISIRATAPSLKKEKKYLPLLSFNN